MSYTVQEGDTLWALSRKLGVPLQDLLRQLPEAVQRDPRKLQIGMELANVNRPNMMQTPEISQAQQRPPMTYAQAGDRATQLGAPVMRSGEGFRTADQARKQFNQDVYSGLAGGTVEAAGALSGLGSLYKGGRGGVAAYGRLRDVNRQRTAAQEAEERAAEEAKSQEFRARMRRQFDEERRLRDADDVASNNAGWDLIKPDRIYDQPLPAQQAIRDRLLRQEQRGMTESPIYPDMSRMSGNIGLGNLHKWMPSGY